MAQSRQKFRQIILQILYSGSFDGGGDELSLVIRENAVPKKQAKEALEFVEKIREKIDEFDPLIAAKAFDYDLERISKIERSILYLGLYELLYTELPDKVAISEAVRLARKYATKEASAFVNAILDAVLKNEANREEQVSC